MFTGVIEEIGSIAGVSAPNALAMCCRIVLEGTAIGDSIAVNGVCLTVTGLRKDGFTADVQPVTRRLSNLGTLREGERVNLERSVGAEQRFGGHYVQGHVDGTARIERIVGEGPSMLIRLTLPVELMRYVVERGFITADGASLTVMRLRSDGVEVSLVDHTQQTITLARKRPGDEVNIEVDVVAKYVERLLGIGPRDKTDISIDFLRKNGFA